MTLAFVLWAIAAAFATWHLFSATSGWSTVQDLYKQESELRRKVLGAFGLQLDNASAEERADVARWKARFWVWWLGIVVAPQAALFGWLHAR